MMHGAWLTPALVCCSEGEGAAAGSAGQVEPPCTDELQRGQNPLGISQLVPAAGVAAQSGSSRVAERLKLRGQSCKLAAPWMLQFGRQARLRLLP